MPRDLVRYQKCGVFHFINFSCYQGKPLLNSASAYRVFEQELEAVRQRYGFVVTGYVLMPEHVHLLLGEPRVVSLSSAIQVLKQLTSRKLKAKDAVHFWQPRYCDFNVHTKSSALRSCNTCIATRSSADSWPNRSSGPGPAFCTMRQGKKALLRSSPNGLREGGKKR